MLNNHLNQILYRFYFEKSIHFIIDVKIKHILVTEGKREYNFLSREEILNWKRKFGEINEF